MKLAHENSGRLLFGKKIPKEDIKVLPSKESITQHISLVFNFKIRKVNDTRREISKLHKDSRQEDASVEDY